MQAPSNSEPAAGRRRNVVLAVIRRLVTPGLVLAVPLVNYAVFLGYPLTSPEFLVIFSAVLLAGLPVALVIWMRPSLLVSILFPLLILLSIDLQFGIDGLVKAVGVEGKNGEPVFSVWLVPQVVAAYVGLSLLIRLAGDHAESILFVVLAVMIASTPLVGDRLTLPSPTVADAVPSPNRDLPPIVYLILDGHSGISGLPPEFPETAAVAANLRQFYENAAFRLYENALSAYDETVASLTDTFAVEKPAAPDEQEVLDDQQYVLESNRLFDALAARDYQVRVHQSSFMDFCNFSNARVASCEIYHQSNVRDIRDTDLGTLQRATVFLTTFASRTLTYRTIFRQAFMSAILDSPQMPPADRFRLGQTPTFGAIPSIRAIDAIAASLPHHGRGVVHLAHLMVPHQSYLLDDDCSIIWPMTEWHLGIEMHTGTFETSDSRRAEHASYSRQSNCLYKKLRSLIKTIDGNPDFDDAIVVFHGDHGSRVLLRKIAGLSDEILKEWERLDYYSTLFAVRAPGIASGVDARELLLREILTEVMEKLWPAVDTVSAGQKGQSKL